MDLSIDPATARGHADSRNISPFLTLPLEIRNKIYHLLIDNVHALTHYFDPAFHEKTLAEQFPPRFLTDSTLPVGSVRGKCAHRADFVRTIFHLNRQIRGEAINLALSAEGFWVVSTINIKDYAVNLRNAGFTTAAHLEASKIANPIITLDIQVEDQGQTQQSDIFAVPLALFRGLLRALWLTVGREKMSIKAHLSNISKSLIDDEWLFEQVEVALARLSDLRGVLHAEINLPSKELTDHCASAREQITTLMLSEPQDFVELSSWLQHALDRARLVWAHTGYVAGEVALVNVLATAWDCALLYPSLCSAQVFFVPFLGQHSLTVREVWRQTHILLAWIRLTLGKPELAIEHCDHLSKGIRPGTRRAGEELILWIMLHYIRGYSLGMIKKHKLAVSDLDIAAAACTHLRGDEKPYLWLGVDFKLLVEAGLQELAKELEDLMPLSVHPLGDIRNSIARATADSD